MFLFSSISSFLISSSQYAVRRTKAEAAHYAIFSIVLSLRPSQIQTLSSVLLFCSTSQSVFFPQCERSKFHTHIEQQAKLQFLQLAFKILDSRWEENAMNQTVANICQMYSVFNFLMHVILIFCGINKYLDFALF